MGLVVLGMSAASRYPERSGGESFTVEELVAEPAIASLAVAWGTYPHHKKLHTCLLPAIRQHGVPLSLRAYENTHSHEVSPVVNTSRLVSFCQQIT